MAEAEFEVYASLLSFYCSLLSHSFNTSLLHAKRWLWQQTTFVGINVIAQQCDFDSPTSNLILTRELHLKH
jgi:hypothetical protein